MKTYEEFVEAMPAEVSAVFDAILVNESPARQSFDDAFGSAYVEFELSRFIWDGRDQWWVIERRQNRRDTWHTEKTVAKTD